MSGPTNAVATLLDRVSEAEQQLSAYLPEGVSVARFMALARRAITEQPRLAECSTVSVLRALSRCAQSGLPLDGNISSLIVRKSKDGPPTASWDPSYKGMITLALSSGHVLEVQGFAVSEHDEFSVEHGTEPKITHKPSVMRSGKIVAAYAWARLRGGGLVVEFVTREDLEQIRASSPAARKGAWRGWFGEMAKKSAIRRLLKRLPAAPARVFGAESGGPAPAADPRLDVPHHRPRPERGLTPEAEHAMTCAALEDLSDAGDVDALEQAWTKIGMDFGQRGLEIPGEVMEQHEHRRAALMALSDGDAGDGDGHGDWLEDYDGAAEA